MSLSKQIVPELRRLGADKGAAAALPADEAGVRRVELAAPGRSARLELLDIDRYSASLLRLTVAGPTLPPVDELAPDAAAQRQARLDALAGAVVARLTYLEEPLAVVESAPAEQSAVVRSSPPLREDATLCYWEVTVSAGEQPALSLARYHWSPELPEREPLPYPAAFAHLGRLADTLAAALAEPVA